MLFGKKKRRIVRLLVVEDEPLIAFDTEHVLGDAGYEVVATVDKVADAVRVIERPGDGDEAAPVDLVLVDVGLADGSGIEVARAAHAQGIAAMFVTGNCPGEASAYANGCLSKPYVPRDLLAAITAIEAALDGETPRRLPPGFRLFERG